MTTDEPDSASQPSVDNIKAVNNEIAPTSINKVVIYGDVHVRGDTEGVVPHHRLRRRLASLVAPTS